MEYKLIQKFVDGIDKDSPIPYYLQLKDVLLDYFSVSEFSVGTKLPREHKLCNIFDLSGTVIRQTLSMLDQEGRTIRQRERGAFIALRKTTENFVQKLTGFH